MTKPLERDIEEKVGRELSQYALSIGVPIYYLKLSVLGMRGWPDRLILWPGRNLLFIEFKRQGEVPRKLQAHIHKTLQDFGFEVQVHDNVTECMAAIKASMAATTRTIAWDEADPRGSWSPPVSPPRKGKD